MKLYILLLMAALMTQGAKAAKYDLIVAQDGTGNYASVQAAIDAAPDSATRPFTIFVKSGKYIGQIIIPVGKTFIELIGADPATTTISFGDGKPGTSAFIINGSDCMVMNITLENSHGYIADGPQSLAVRTTGSRIVFLNCRFISGQDTVLLSKAGSMVYLKNCYIDGNTDFIYGAAIGVFDDCIIYARDRVDGSRGGYITAASTPAGQAYGLVFRNCILPENHGITAYTLGRPWQNDERTETQGRIRAENKVVFINTKMGRSILPQGWSLWDKGTLTTVITYAEYKTQNLDGTPGVVSQRVSWSKQLTDAEAYLKNDNLFGQWDPYKVWPELSKPFDPPATVTNFLARAIDGLAVLQFNSSWPVAGVTYRLFKSIDNGLSFKESAHMETKPGVSIAYAFTDQLPLDGQSSYYLLRAFKGSTVVVSDTLQVNLENIHTVKMR